MTSILAAAGPPNSPPSTQAQAIIWGQKAPKEYPPLRKQELESLHWGMQSPAHPKGAVLLELGACHRGVLGGRNLVDVPLVKKRTHAAKGDLAEGDKTGSEKDWGLLVLGREWKVASVLRPSAVSA